MAQAGQLRNRRGQAWPLPMYPEWALLATESQGASFAKAGSVLREGGQASPRKSVGLVGHSLHHTCIKFMLNPRVGIFRSRFSYDMRFFSSKVKSVLRWTKVDLGRLGRARSKKPPTLRLESCARSYDRN